MFRFTAAAKSIPMIFNQRNDTSTARNSLSAALRGYFVRYQMVLYILFAAATSVSVAWNWNWLTGAEVFRIMAALPCSFMMLVCMKRASCR
jgi:hypothetical protein